MEAPLNQRQQEILLDIAQQTVENYVRFGQIPDFEVEDERLWQPEGAFVTLYNHGQLRGCIGRVVSNQPLWQTVRDMAVSAATQDPRFQPISPEELPELTYEVSVLSVPQEIGDWRKIELGKHGVIIQRGLNSGVFLPQVAEETGWNLEEFLTQLCVGKAGLEPDCYKNPQTTIKVFTAQVFKRNANQVGN